MLTKSPGGPKIKFLVQSIEENRCLSQKLIYFFRLIHFYLALDFGFMEFKSIRAKIMMKMFTFTLSVIYTALGVISFLKYENLFIRVWYACYMIEYFLYVTVTSFMQSNKSFYDLQNDLLAIDSEIKADSNTYKIESKLLFCLSAVIVIRFVYSFLFCHYNHMDCLLLASTILFYIPIYLSNDIMMIMYTFMFYSVCCRVTKFTHFMKKDRRDIVSCEYTYKALIDSTQEAMKTFEAIFVVCLLCNTPQVMMTVYFVLALIQGIDVGGIASPPFIISAGVTIAQAVMLVSLPSFYAGKLLSENEKLKLAAHSILLRETDAMRCRDLKRFIKYMEARPFKFTVLKIIPVDWTLPVLIINIIVTYLIVAIQFSHLY